MQEGNTVRFGILFDLTGIRRPTISALNQIRIADVEHKASDERARDPSMDEYDCKAQ